MPGGGPAFFSPLKCSARLIRKTRFGQHALNTAPLRRGTKKRNRKNIWGVGRYLSNPLCEAGRAVGVSAPRTEGARARSERHEIDEYEKTLPTQPRFLRRPAPHA